jgi:hypothetical protein
MTRAQLELKRLVDAEPVKRLQPADPALVDADLQKEALQVLASLRRRLEASRTDS